MLVNDAMAYQKKEQKATKEERIRVNLINRSSDSFGRDFVFHHQTNTRQDCHHYQAPFR